MKLIRRLLELQEEHGFLDETTLQKLSEEEHIPLSRLQGLLSFYPHFRTKPPADLTLKRCRDVCCHCARDQQTKSFHSALEASLHQSSLSVEIEDVSCLGCCEAAPMMMWNHKVISLKTEQERTAALEVLSQGKEPTELFQSSDRFACSAPVRNWKLDPYSSPNEHFGTVQNCLKKPHSLAKHCIEVLQESQLQGRGGAGFPTGVKWEMVQNAHSDLKYIICNADESEPGTFKDRVLLEEFSHLVIEGMLLAGLAVGATRGIVFIRHEYEQQRLIIENTIQVARQRGWLGESVGGSQLSFEIEIFVSPGGYILGEETALLEALEDKRGEPRNKPPYPVTSGFWGKPTLINNVETFACATSIIHHGADWWHKQGLEGFSGLKICSISGDVEKPGAYEVPMGTTVRELVNKAGGVKEGKEVKAFLPGGASSAFLFSNALDTPIDFASMKEAGSTLGTGALILFHEDRDLLEVAANITRFFRNESCGKCVPCRLGTEMAVRILDLSNGSEYCKKVELANAGELLTELEETLRLTSICGLGQVALTPLISYWDSEFAVE